MPAVPFPAPADIHGLPLVRTRSAGEPHASHHLLHGPWAREPARPFGPAAARGCADGLPAVERSSRRLGVVGGARGLVRRHRPTAWGDSPGRRARVPGVAGGTSILRTRSGNSPSRYQVRRREGRHPPDGGGADGERGEPSVWEEIGGRRATHEVLVNEAPGLGDRRVAGSLGSPALRRLLVGGALALTQPVELRSITFRFCSGHRVLRGPTARSTPPLGGPASSGASWDSLGSFDHRGPRPASCSETYADGVAQPGTGRASLRVVVRPGSAQSALPRVARPSGRLGLYRRHSRQAATGFGTKK